MMASMPGQYLLIRGDARHLPLASGSVHCCACSPPYFNLRDYGDPRQIGLEPTPQVFIEAMQSIGREVWRVLRDDGSWWINLGDSFNSASQGNKNGGGRSGLKKDGRSEESRLRTNAGTASQMKIAGRRKDVLPSLKPKDLIMIPERVALALQADGWFLRAKPPWLKPNPMPDSTDDRPNVAHESIFLLTKNERYYFDMEAVRVPSAASTLARDEYSRITKGKDGAYAVAHDHETPSDPGGRHLRTNDFFTASLDVLIEHHEDYLAHLRSVRDKGGLLLSEGGNPLAFWQATKSFSGAHFATWPPRLVEPMIKASTSEKGCCPACGAPWVRMLETVGKLISGNPRGERAVNGPAIYRNVTEYQGFSPSCSCNAGDPIPCVILDNFSGAGTTVLTAEALGRFGIGVDLNANYLAMARRRIERPHARVARPSRTGAPTPLLNGLDAES
jgi:DNA modification methylase